MSRASNLAGFTTAIGVPPSSLNVGVLTAASFVGSGENLTSLPAGQLTGTLPTISGANLTNIPAGQLTGTVADARISTLTASKLTGALPAIDGSALTGTGVGTETSINTTGIITAASFSGDGSSLTGTGVGTDTSINTTGIITATSFSGDGSSLTGVGGGAASNMIDNGEFLVNQRGESSYTTNNGFTFDRWRSSYDPYPTYSFTQSTDAPDGFENSVKIQCTSTSGGGGEGGGAYQYGTFSQAIEGYHSRELGWTNTSSAKNATLSFYAKASNSGTWCVTIGDYSGSHRYVATYTIASADTWERITINIPAPSSGTWKDDNNRNIRIYFDLGAGSLFQTSSPNQWINGSGKQSTSSAFNMATNLNSYIYLTGIQLEVGDSASDYVYEDYHDALIRAQRYYKRLFVFPEINKSEVFMGDENSSLVWKFFDLQADLMRANPSTSLINNSDIEVRNTDGTWGSGNNFSSGTAGTFPLLRAYVYRSSDSSTGVCKRLRKSTAGDVLMEVSADI